MLVEGKCGKPSAEAAYQCKPGDESGCKAQCDKGHPGSCRSLAKIIGRKDPKTAVTLLDKACQGDDGVACAWLAVELLSGKNTTADPAKAKSTAERACRLGAAEGCTVLGRTLKDDAAAAQAAFSKGCAGGDPKGCAEAGKAMMATDATKALKLHERACHGGVAASCIPVANAYDSGESGFGKNPIRASMLYRRACYSGNALGCFHLGRLDFASNPDNAKRSFKMACTRQEKLGCAALVVAFGEKKTVMFPPNQKRAASQACIKGSPLDCVMAGIMEGATGAKSAAGRFKSACMRGNKPACAFEKALKKP